MLASSIGQIAHPFFIAFASLIEGFYSLVQNYAVAIALLTLVVMIVVFPITRRATRSMMKMQLLAPELKKIQARYKAQPTMTATEKQQARQRLNEEMMALYRENGVSPTGGCLPMLLQLPIFWILYGTIRGLIHTRVVAKGTAKAHTVPAPLYISHHSALYHAVALSHGRLDAFGINLADSVRSGGLSWPGKIPYIAMILVAIGLQYIQIKQVSGRNAAAAAANPQMQQMQRIMPLIFAVIYIAIPAGVNVYFIISSLFRIGQQEYMYRRDPHIRQSMEALKARAKNEPKVVETKGNEERPKSLFERLLSPGPAPALRPANPPRNGEAKPQEAPAAPPPKVPAADGGRSLSPRGRGPGGSPGRSQSRARGKRPRRPR